MSNNNYQFSLVSPNMMKHIFTIMPIVNSKYIGVKKPPSSYLKFKRRTNKKNNKMYMIKEKELINPLNS